MNQTQYCKLFDRVYLSLKFPIQSTMFWKLYTQCHSLDKIYEMVSLNEIENFPNKEADLLIKDKAKEIIEYCEKNSVEIIALDSPNYPQRLKEIQLPPIVLYCLGNSSCLSHSPCAAIIGSRKASEYSLKAAREFSGALVKNNCLIISGFANGIDTAAHKAAIEYSGETIAVLGCGVHYDYPKRNAALKELVVEKGAVISEYPPFSPPKPENFKVRNRIISALSNFILVIQAGVKSGTLNTVSHALEQGKTIFSIPPHDIFSMDYQGQSSLLRDGAAAVYSPRDLIVQLEQLC